MKQVDFSTFDASRFFTRPSFRALSNGVAPSRRQLGLPHSLYKSPEKCLVRDAIDDAYKLLSSQHRGEYVYKNEIVSRVIFGRHSPRTAGFCSELAVGNSIADVVVFNGTSTAYEIKTELDGLQRLPTQLNDYLQAFDRINVVTHSAAAEAVMRIAPKSVGVLVLGKKGVMSEIRKSESNIENINPAVVFGFLRRSEYLAILLRTYGWEAKVAPHRLVTEARGLFCQLDPATAHAEAVLQLRGRTTDIDKSAFVQSLPYGLRALGLSQPLSRKAQGRLLDVLQGLTI